MKRTSVYSKILLVFVVFSFVNATIYAGDPVRSKKGMVVASEKIAAKIGAKILNNGGNAVDAAVAVGFSLAVTFPYAGNIGGGGFMVIHLADGRNITIDFREKAPLTAFREMYIDKNGKVDSALSKKGWSSCGVPGTVAGLIYALEKYGTMKLKDVIQPAIDLAENGFIIPYHLAESINKAYKNFLEYKSSRKIFTLNGKPIKENVLFVQKDLAKTLRLIRDLGTKGFYEGKIAKLITEQSQANGGYISLQDLKEYKAVERNPVIGKYKDYDIISMPPPSAGGVAVIEALNIIQNFNIDKSEWGSSEYYKMLVDVLKYVYYDRGKYMGDPDFIKIPIDLLTSKNYAASIYDKISKNVYPHDSFKETPDHKETTHYSIADKNGNAVSTTYTLNSAYGCKVVVDGAGFLMNNEMDDFSAKPGIPNQFGLVSSEANSISAGKRMLSSMSPVIVLKGGKPYLITGSPGGSTIITAVLQVVLNVLEFNMNIREAVEKPRIHHQYLPDRIDYEPNGLPKDVRENLVKKGEKIGKKMFLGCVESILIDENGIFWGASDPRGSGFAAGN